MLLNKTVIFMDYFNIIRISKIKYCVFIFRIVFAFDHNIEVTVFAIKYTLKVFKFSNTLKIASAAIPYFG